MALFDASRPVVAKTGFGARIHTSITGVASALIAWNERRVTRQELAKLSEHQLNDLGMTRGDIETLYRR
jgi:uncharacterized protein YjiS (DUF1127 family)